MADFAADVSRWVEKAKARAEAAFRATAEDALARVRELTPVRTGNLRANWQISLGNQALPVQGGLPEGGVPLSAIVGDLKLGQVLVILNPVSYARPVEYGYQRQTANGTVDVPGKFMLTQTIEELPSIALAAAQRVSRAP